jgi:hypothetical protein
MDASAIVTARDAVRPRSIAADALFVLGAIGTGAGAYLYYTDHGGRIAVTPAVAPGSAAVGVTGEF